MEATMKKHMYCMFFLCLVSMNAYADPWGKDADLSKSACSACSPTCCPTPVLGGVSEVLIGFHQKVISPADGPRSHFLPSSSQYTLDAMRKYGFFEGYLLGCDRLMRENSEEWIYPTSVDGRGYSMKLDPVR
jgi:uncharacterized protein